MQCGEWSMPTIVFIFMSSNSHKFNLEEHKFWTHKLLFQTNYAQVIYQVSVFWNILYFIEAN